MHQLLLRGFLTGEFATNSAFAKHVMELLCKPLPSEGDPSATPAILLATSGFLRVGQVGEMVELPVQGVLSKRLSQCPGIGRTWNLKNTFKELLSQGIVPRLAPMASRTVGLAQRMWMPAG